MQSGDSLWAIAQRFQVAVDDVRKWNNLTVRASKRALKVGSVLYVWPSNAPAQVVERAGTVVAQKAPAGRAGTVHSLAAGESVWSVAQRYGITVEDIKRWNHISDTSRLPTGLKLTVSAP